MKPNPNTLIATDLRKLAAELRNKAAQLQEQQTIKCAQILTAAQGLNQLRDILKGVR